MVRLILLLLAAILYLILTLPVLFILWLIGKKNPDLRERTASAMIRWIFRVLLAGAGVKVTVIGQDRIPSDTAVLTLFSPMCGAPAPRAMWRRKSWARFPFSLSGPDTSAAFSLTGMT